MLTTRRTRLRQRRGVALILILGMLGLLALIGVTFATFTGQARIGARNYAQAALRPQGGDLMDFALSQLIGDTNDVRSAIRGHSLARDMYGSDAAFNGYLDQNPANLVNGQLQFTAATMAGDGTIQAVTNIPLGHAAFYGYNFARWTVKFDAMPGTVGGGIETRLIGQTFEVLVDDVSGSVDATYRVFRLTPPASVPLARAGYLSPDIGVATATAVGGSQLIGEAAGGVPLNTRFTLDGRFLRAFNGAGMGYVSAVDPPAAGNYAAFANMRYNGGILTGNNALVAAGDPNASTMPGMDEDYDACDMENWFLAIQSADGKVIIPSFHRPGILGVYGLDVNGNPITDWTLKTAQSRSKILRPRKADGHSAQSFPDLRPNPTTGRIEFDVDNDGDGLTDSVWVDLGYPAVKDSRGLLYKPLFAFMVIGLNGRIPLNTAGNLQLRGPGGGSQRNMHTSRLGISPSEVDPTFGLQNAPPTMGLDAMGNPMVAIARPQFDNAIDANNNPAPVGVNVTQLRNILTGTRPHDSSGTDGDLNALTTTHYNPDGSVAKVENAILPNNLPDQADANFNRGEVAIPGRWGEAGEIPATFYNTYDNPWMSFQNWVRAGFSTPTLWEAGADGRDGNHTAFDFWPLPTAGETPGLGWPADYYDAAGDFAIPAERIRRFVTPIDIYGDGEVAEFKTPNTTGTAGTDDFGRVAFDKHFRPPGIPTPTVTLAPVDTANFPATIAGQLPAPPATVTDITNNPLHGFESQRNPVLGSDERGALRYAATPTNIFYNTSTNANEPTMGPDPSDPMAPPIRIVTSNGNTIPSYDNVINSMRMGRTISEADEMNLYQPSSADDPYGYQDLEWLYRAQDREGPSLFSRLADLAPVSFRDSIDAQRRRRLYSIDTWETNAVVWTNDNPVDPLWPAGRFQDNSRFAAYENASLANTGAPFVAVAGTNAGSSSAPALAHRERKINLNYPLPVSNSPDEPTRRKWITESYQLLKSTLPPLSLDTAEELAMLSQFLVNVIDFRDPDATLTRFTNPDVFIHQNAGAQPTLVLASAAAAGDLPLIQYGMEYNPIAIHEVLAYSFQSKMGGPQRSVGRFFIELVNTLTKARSGGASTVKLGGFDYVVNNPYQNGCWDLIFTDDTPAARPDPFTGQLLPLPAAGVGHYAPIPLNRDSFVENKDVRLRPLDETGPPTASPTAVNYYYVLGNALPDATSEVNSPSGSNPNANNPSLTQTIKPEFDPLAQAPLVANPASLVIPEGVLPPAQGGGANTTYPGRIPALATPGTAAYKWVCLRRPVNPFAPVSATNPMVVVDSMRFHFIEGTGPLGTTPVDGDGSPIPDTSKANRIYSTQRFQPYRGGQAVVNPTTNKLDPHYGYTEQLATAGSSVTNNTRGQYNKDSKGATHPATLEVYNSLGGADPLTNNRDRPWDYFAFNDRDFVSAAELLLVPGCPPGLFTKQFAEFAPTVANNAKFSAGAPATVPVGAPATPIVSPPNFTARFGDVPRSYPYLVDRFFYTSASPGLNGSPTWDLVRGPSAGGWYKMFEFFEVPTRANGATASAAHGYNYDWFRQDTRPGQLNLNLIVDEEVFLGLIGNAGLRTNNPPSAQDSAVPPNTILYQQVRSVPSALNGNPVPLADITGLNAPLKGFVPQVITEWDPADAVFVGAGAPAGLPYASPPLATPTQRAAYPMSNVGFFHDPDGDGVGDNRLKAAFSDFLKIRHGGSGYLFGPLPEAPFRSLSHPDINATIMRPAFATAGVDTTNATIANRYYRVPNDHGMVKKDAGVKNPDRLDPAAAALVLPPAVPPRRLFQLPDDEVTSNANDRGESSQLGYTPPVNTSLEKNWDNLTDGGGLLKHSAMQPYWKSEWMQKMMNLSTVRTHQYAVWVTVGFFEVVSQGDPASSSTTNPDAAYDVIGREVGLIGGKSVRHRGFFIVDRLKLEGFDPTSPGKFRDAVVYRRMIQ